MSLKESQTEDLLFRWNMLIDDYLKELKDLNSLLLSIDKKRNELLLIREELVSRNVDPEEEKKIESQDARRSDQPAKSIL